MFQHILCPSLYTSELVSFKEGIADVHVESVSQGGVKGGGTVNPSPSELWQHKGSVRLCTMISAPVVLDNYIMLRLLLYEDKPLTGA